MAYEITRRYFLKYAAGVAASVGGLGAITTDGFAQSRELAKNQPSGNASRKFLELLVNNLYTEKVTVEQDGSYQVLSPKGEGHDLYFMANYKTLGATGQAETLVVVVVDNRGDNRRRFKFENPGLEDMPARVTEYMWVVIGGASTSKEVKFDVANAPKSLQEAHRKAYERALNELSKYLSSAPAKAKSKK